MNAKTDTVKLRNNRKLKVFLVLLFLSFFYWFFTTLSEQYNYTTALNIQYKNLPKNLLFQSTPNPTIKAQIKASGFNLLSHKVKPKFLAIDVSEFKKGKGYQYYYLPNKEIRLLQQQFDKTELIHFIKDSILISLGNLKSKKIPIELTKSLAFKPGYKLTEEISIQPDSILIKGPEEIVDKITTIKTEELILSEIDDSFEHNLKLVSPQHDSKAFSFEDKSVIVNGLVSKYTQATLEIPIRIKNLPQDIQMEIFPKTATIKYQVAFENYQKISEKSFKLSCTYPTDSLSSNKTLLIAIDAKPNFITDFSLLPQQVTYLIKR